MDDIEIYPQEDDEIVTFIGVGGREHHSFEKSNNLLKNSINNDCENWKYVTNCVSFYFLVGVVILKFGDILGLMLLYCLFF